MPRLSLLVTSPRLAPGLLTREAWLGLSSADVILAADLTDPLPAALADLGMPPASPSDLAPAALARTLVDRARDADVMWIGSPGGDADLSDAIAAEVTALEQPPEVELVVGSWDLPGSRLLDVVAVMDRLRSPGGCPWDAEQTHASLAPYLIEEAHETLEAITAGDPHHLAEELGDVLLQVAFHARVAAEAPTDPFDIDTVAALLVAKLVRRHPHVFADGEASSPEEVEVAWEAIKAAERAAAPARPADGGPGADLLRGIPTTLPADLVATKVADRIRRRALTPDPEAAARVDRALAEFAAAETALRAAVHDLAASL